MATDIVDTSDENLHIYFFEEGRHNVKVDPITDYKPSVAILYA